MADLNIDATFLAERALELDPKNLMGHAILARQFLIEGKAEAADPAWAATLAAGGAVVWTATLYEVDARTYFILAFDRQAIRVYRFGQLAGVYNKGLGGVPEIPGPAATRPWSGLGGCLDPAVVPEASCRGRT